MDSQHSTLWTIFLVIFRTKQYHTVDRWAVECNFWFNVISVPALMSYSVATNSPLESRVVKLVQNLIEMGYMTYSEGRVFYLIRHLIASEQSKPTSVEGNDATKVLMYFMSLSVGCVVAILVFFAEIIYFRYSQNVQKKTQFSRAKKIGRKTNLREDLNR